MPATVNGIGTTYFGKRNRRQFEGVCQNCHRPGRLENYETWLVFSVFFIPVVPLGKKQVLNYCPRCRRHNVIGYSQWQRAQQEAVDAAAAELAGHAHDPDAAIRMHATYDGFQMHDDAARFADAMLALYGDIARVQFYLAAWYERLGHKEQAEAAFAAAHRIEPNNLVFQRAVAIGHIEQGRLDEARQMLESFKPPAETFEPQLFFLLAGGYQTHGRHEEALEQFKMLAAVRPALLNDRSFRKAVRRSEWALGAPESLVGREPFYRSRALWAGLGAAALLAAFLGANWYVRNHRRLYLVNGLQVPIAVKIDDGTAVNVPAQGHTVLPVVEGRHTAAMSQPELGRQPTEFEIGSHWFAGVFQSPAYIVDPSGSAVVLYEEASYAAPGDTPPQATHQWHVAEPLVVLPAVDYPFQPFPMQVQVKKRHPVRKSRVSLMTLPPMQLVMMLSILPGMGDKVLPLAEAHLRATPDDQLLLFAYWAMSARQRQFERCSQFLSARLSDTPLRVDWHRAWQSIRREQDKDQELVRQYDELLAAEPGNSTLIYLRGRCERDSETSMEYFERAIAADASNPYPRFAQAVAWQGRGDLRRARAAAGDAVRLNARDLQMKHTLDRLRFALGEYADLEKELRGSLAAAPLVLAEQERLLEVLVAQGKVEQAQQQVEAFRQQAGAQQPQQAEGWTRRLRYALLYLQGKFDELLAAASQPAGDAESAAARYHAQFELGQVVEPPPGISVLDEGQDPFAVLCQALALRERGDNAAADATRAKAVEQLRQGLRERRDTADVLAKRGVVDQNDLGRLPHDPRLRTIALVTLAETSDPPDPRLLELAETLNFDRRFPYHFLRRTIQRLRQPSAAERAEAP